MTFVYLSILWSVFVIVGSAQNRYKTLKQYCLNHLWVSDRKLNAWFGGSSKELISTRIYNYRNDNKVAFYCYKVLNWIDTNHCELAAHRDYDPEHSADAVLK